MLLICLVCLGHFASMLRADLQADVQKILAGPGLGKVDSGVQIVRLGQLRELDQTLVSVQAAKPFIPASNLKLLTTAAAIDVLGEEFSFKTVLARNGNTVAVVGDGDPTLGDSEFLSGTGWTIQTVYENWAADLKRAGVTAIDRLLVDDSVFDDRYFHANWPLDQAHKDYVPQVSGLNLNANCLDVFLTRTPQETVSFRINPPTKFVTVENSAAVGSPHSLWLSRVLGTNRIVLRGLIDGSNREPFRVTIHDPTLYAGAVLAEVLRSKGISVGAVDRDRTIRRQLDKPDSPWRAMSVHSTALGPMLAHTNKDSVNLYAEALCKRLGAIGEQPGSWENGDAGMIAYAMRAGASKTDFVLDDGCGLSKLNRATPAGFCAVLAGQFHGPSRKMYLDSMSVGGVDGTLAKRYRGTDLVGRVFAKSGTVNGVSTLSGYLKSKSGDWYAFSILMNNIADRGVGQRAQDEIVRTIDGNAD